MSCYNIAAKFGVCISSYSRGVPISPTTVLTKDPEHQLPAGNQYRSLVGSLLYLAGCTRPDIAHVVGNLARYMSAPSKAHWNAAISVLKYVASTADTGVSYSRDAEINFTGYCDANYAGDPDNRRSTSGFVFLSAGGAISWSSKLQPTTALSTMEAEYQAAAHAAKEALWLRKLAAAFGVPQPLIPIWCDNQAALALLYNPITSPRSKHIDVVHHFVRQRIARGEISFEYIPTDRMAADYLTKSLSAAKLEICKDLCGVGSG